VTTPSVPPDLPSTELVPGRRTSAPPALPPAASYAVPLSGPVQGYYYLPAGQQLAPTSPSGVPLAAFSDRLLARIIDSVIIGGIASVLIIPIYLIIFIAVFDVGTTVTTHRDPLAGPVATDPVNPFSVLLPVLGLMAVLVLLIFILAYLYEVELMFRGGQTIGKRAMKIKIIPVDPALRLTRGMAAKRFLVMQVGGIVPGLSLLDGLWQLWDKPYRQCLHDKVSSTLVIKLKP
jgi:uncharacterized RDD family membrane protein YckC